MDSENSSLEQPHGPTDPMPASEIEWHTREGPSLKRGIVVAIQGDLTLATTDVIVNAANEYLRHGGGIAAALARVGGKEFLEDSDRWVAENGPLRSGQAAVTAGGGLGTRWVVHVVGPRYRTGQDNAALLREAVRAALGASAAIGAGTVAMPAISTGVFGYPLVAAAELIASECIRWMEENPGQLTEIQLVGYDRRAADAFRHGLEQAPQ